MSRQLFKHNVLASHVLIKIDRCIDPAMQLHSMMEFRSPFHLARVCGIGTCFDKFCPKKPERFLTIWY